jgi:DNA repair exonuclease SbcCD ATPase subunit
MNNLSISKISLKNFKGIKSFSFSPMGENATLHGDNGTGKTTIFDAFTWLFFGKDSQGKADSQIKPVDKDGNERHNLDTEVEAVLEFNNKPITLLRRFSEKWTKKRGAATADFTGHTTDYFIDEVPAKQKEFNEKIAEIININSFKLVTNPMEFNALHWTGQRQILVEMCGDVTDHDVIDSDKKLSSLADILGDCTIDDHKKKIQSKKRDINKELEQIPARIDELTHSIQDAEKPDQRDFEQLDAAMNEQKENLRQEQNNEALSAKAVRLNEVNAAILQANNDANSKALEAKKPINAEIDKLEAEYRTLVNQIATLNDQIKQDNTRNRINADSREKLRAEFISERDTEKNVVDTCPACDQALPPEKVQAAIEKNNQIRAERLEKNMAEGRNLKSQFDEREKAIVDAQAKIDEISVKIPAIEKELQAQKNKLAKVYEPVNVDDLDREKDILESDMKAIRNGAMTRERDILAKIEQAQADMDAWKEKEAAFRAAEKSRARIEELEGQEKKLAAEYERLESELYLIEQFIVAKVGMLESQINSKFKLAKFTLFETQINGGIAECCHTTYKGVKFNHGLNSGARIQVGLDIINTLSDYYGFRAPIFIDNKESVTSLPDSDSQLISLVVDPAYKKLTVHQTEARKAS